MSRRKPLSKVEKEKRSGKRAMRRAGSAKRSALRQLYSAVAQAKRYIEGDATERCVCERCGLEQTNHRGICGRDGYVTVYTCRGFEGIGCGSETAVTLEQYAPAT